MVEQVVVGIDVSKVKLDVGSCPVASSLRSATIATELVSSCGG